MAVSINADNRFSEWLEADGLGGFASGTVCGIRTRRYHALLLAATTPPAGRMVLVNGQDVDLELAIGRFGLGSQRYAPGVDVPNGANWLESFDLEPWPRWTCIVPDGKIVRELFVPHGLPAVVQRWTWVGDDIGTRRLHVRPFFSGRDFHALHHENPAFRFTPREVPHGQRWSFYDGVPEVTARSNGIYQHEPQWYRNFLYDEEAARGLDHTEDLAAPGVFVFDLATEPAVLIFSCDALCATPPTDAITAKEIFQQTADTEEKRRAAFASPRHKAADAYVVPRGDGRTIIAGYPWFGDWGRDTFIALRGLCLATGRLEEARQILVAWAGAVSEGMLPNRFPDRGDVPEYNSVDASLWYIIAVHEFLALAGKGSALSAQADQLHAACDAILTGYERGTRYGIRLDADGLLACGVPGVQLTWMDAKVGDEVVTPRIGKPVEIQALWLNALQFVVARADRWATRLDQGRAAFAARYWNEARGCLFDVVDVDHQPGRVDDSIRPNQIFAVGGLPLTLLNEERAGRVVQVVQEKLWTPLGLRSLAPGEPGYCPHYGGSPWERDHAYHQGTVWPWLAGPFVEAWARVHGGTRETWKEARELFLAPRLGAPDLAGLGHVPEIADAELPHTERGCPFQAWSLGELLRVG